MKSRFEIMSNMTGEQLERRSKLSYKGASSDRFFWVCFYLEVNGLAKVSNAFNNEIIWWNIALSSKTFTRVVATEGSFLLEDFEARVLENAAALPNLDNITVCKCRGHCLCEISVRAEV